MTQFSPTEKRKIRTAMSNYMLRAEHASAGIHYSQARPYHHLGVTPEHGFTADCSSYVTGIYFWGSDQSNLPVRDPNGMGWSGYGWTGTLLHENIGHAVPDHHVYMVGDMCLYGPAYRTKHVTVCRKGGDANTSIWSSHGSERGPYPTRMNYRSDRLCVLRGKSLL